MRSAVRLQLILVCSVFTVSQLGYLYVFPILPDITQDFFPELTESELGFRQGYLAGIYFLGNFCGSFVWGKIADKIGRKRALILSTTLFTICIAIFGLSVSFSMALVVRFLWGLFNGLDTIVKTFATEICENDQDRARAISALGLTDGMGRMVGPTISAWLSRPADKFSWLDNAFLRRFPYFLPSMTCVCMAVVSLLLSAVWMRETLTKSGNVRQSVVRKEYIRVEMRELEERESSSCSEEEVVAGEDEKMQLTREETPEHIEHSRTSSNLKQTLKKACSPLLQRSVLSAILVYNMYCFISIQFDELTPLMLVTPPSNGGFCMSENALGFVTLLVSFIQIPWALLVGPLIISRLGVRKAFRLILILFIITVFFMPLWTRNGIVENSFTDIIMSHQNYTYMNGTRLFSRDNMSVFEHSSSNTNISSWSLSICHGERQGITDIPAKAWAIFFSVYIPNCLSRITVFACTIIAVGNSARREERATVNGVSQSGAAIMRLIGPIVSANIYAWSIAIGYRWPIDATLIWSLGCIQLMILFVTSFLLTPQIEHPID